MGVQVAGDFLGEPVRPSSWDAVHLGPVIAGLLDGTLSHPTPSVGRVAGGGWLFYRGRVNGIAGESTSGKTWTALVAAAAEMAAGQTVVFIDHEDNALGVVSRLLSLGVDPGVIQARLSYHNPSERPTSADLAHLAAEVAERRPTLAVVDSTGEGLALDGANPNADEQVAAWFLRVPRRLAAIQYDGQPGPAVLVLDHVSKADDGGVWPIGSQRKRAGITGALYMQRTVTPFSQHTAGAAALIVSKDRAGTYVRGQQVAELRATPTGGGHLNADLVAVEASMAGPESFRPTGYMERVSVAIEGATEPLAFNRVCSRVSGKRQHVRQALDVLVAEGFVTTTAGPNRATLHTSAKPYREADDGGNHPGAAIESPSGSSGSGSLGGEPPEPLNTWFPELPGNHRELLGTTDYVTSATEPEELARAGAVLALLGATPIDADGAA